MKSFKTFMVLLIAVACILSTLVINEAQAAPVWAQCYVNSTGQGNSQKFVQVTDATGTNPGIVGAWFTISSAFGGDNQMLSTALTAMTSGMKVTIYALDTVPFSPVTAIYLLGQ